MGGVIRRGVHVDLRWGNEDLELANGRVPTKGSATNLSRLK